ncbi:MAG: hypothetical protein CL804_03465 [Citromicrobium sp.]|nr:hypothetical protein [Citromicrobium sp.]|tara:strand:- start:2825 stop:3076 length:252 start_codon:yes stop_codon:yes gene_type:complete
MAMKTYIALQKGQAPNGAVIEAGERFTAEFRTIVRDEVKNEAGKVISRPAATDDEGQIKTVVAKEPPSWAREEKAAEKSAKAD